MKLLTIDDVVTFIPKATLENLLEVEDSNGEMVTSYAMLDSLEEYAIAELSGYISHKFDVDLMIAQKNDTLLKQMVIDILIYNLFVQCSPINIPDHRVNRYEKVIKMLHDIAKGTLSPQYFIERTKDKLESPHEGIVGESIQSYIYNL